MTCIFQHSFSKYILEEDILQYIKKKEVKWFGLLKKMNNNLPNKHTWRDTVQRFNSTGCPKKTGSNNIQDILKKREVSLSDVQSTA